MYVVNHIGFYVVKNDTANLNGLQPDDSTDRDTSSSILELLLSKYVVFRDLSLTNHYSCFGSRNANA